MKDFLEFVRKQGVAGLAIGFILGGSVTTLVKSLVEDIINPIIGLLIPNLGTLDNWSLTLGKSVIKYGHFLGVTLNFIIIAWLVYFIFKRLEKYLDKKD